MPDSTNKSAAREREENMLKGERASRSAPIRDTDITYPPELLPAMQSVLRILADLAFDHESELEQLRSSGAHPELKRQIEIRLEERYSRRRAPYLQYLSELQSQALASVRAAEKEAFGRRYN
jgi:hypothetical protein